MQALAGASGLEGVNVVRCATVLFIFARFSQIFGEKCPLCPLYPPPPLQNICSKSCLKRGSEISVRLWNFAGFLTRNCSFLAYFCATERKRKLFERAGLPACARRYGWHDGRSIAQMVESGKFGWALGACQNRGEFLATSGELHWDAQPTTLDNPKSGMHPWALGCGPQRGGVFGDLWTATRIAGETPAFPGAIPQIWTFTLRARSGASRSGGMAQRGACWLDEPTGPRIPHRPP